MNFQEKMFDTTEDLRARAASFASAAITTARSGARVAAKRAEGLKGSLAKLTLAGRELNKVARRHAARFVTVNSSIAADAGKDVSALARTTFATLVKRGAAPKKASKAPAARKRAAAKAA